MPRPAGHCPRAASLPGRRCSPGWWRPRALPATRSPDARSSGTQPAWAWVRSLGGLAGQALELAAGAGIGPRHQRRRADQGVLIGHSLARRSWACGRHGARETSSARARRARAWTRSEGRVAEAAAVDGELRRTMDQITKIVSAGRTIGGGQQRQAAGRRGRRAARGGAGHERPFPPRPVTTQARITRRITVVPGRRRPPRAPSAIRLQARRPPAAGQAPDGGELAVTEVDSWPSSSARPSRIACRVPPLAPGRGVPPARALPTTSASGARWSGKPWARRGHVGGST